MPKQYRQCSWDIVERWVQELREPAAKSSGRKSLPYRFIRQLEAQMEEKPDDTSLSNAKANFSKVLEFLTLAIANRGKSPGHSNFTKDQFTSFTRTGGTQDIAHKVDSVLRFLEPKGQVVVEEAGGVWTAVFHYESDAQDIVLRDAKLLEVDNVPPSDLTKADSPSGNHLEKKSPVWAGDSDVSYRDLIQSLAKLAPIRRALFLETSATRAKKAILKVVQSPGENKIIDIYVRDPAAVPRIEQQSERTQGNLVTLILKLLEARDQTGSPIPAAKCTIHFYHCPSAFKASLVEGTDSVATLAGYHYFSTGSDPYEYSLDGDAVPEVVQRMNVDPRGYELLRACAEHVASKYRQHLSRLPIELQLPLTKETHDKVVKDLQRRHYKFQPDPTAPLITYIAGGIGYALAIEKAAMLGNVLKECHAVILQIFGTQTAELASKLLEAGATVDVYLCDAEKIFQVTGDKNYKSWTTPQIDNLKKTAARLKRESALRILTYGSSAPVPTLRAVLIEHKTAKTPLLVVSSVYTYHREQVNSMVVVHGHLHPMTLAEKGSEAAIAYAEQIRWVLKDLEPHLAEVRL